MASVSNTESVETVDERTKPPFLRRVRIRGYKSIAFCDVTLEPLTILVGRNASGKSNFLDALAFLRDVMALGVSEAVKRRGGWSAIACRTSAAQAIEMEIEASFTCGRPFARVARNGPSDAASPNLEGQAFSAKYHLELSPDASSVPAISRERLRIADSLNRSSIGFALHGGISEPWTPEPGFEEADLLPPLPPLLGPMRPDHPVLGLHGQQPIIDLWAGLRYMAFYNFIPEAMRRPQKPTPGQLLDQNGWNLASVLASTRQSEEWVFERIGSYLSAIVPQVERFEVAQYGEYETIRFRLCSPKPDEKLEFDAASMSDGTLRVLAALTAAFQNVPPHGCPSVVGIEEPESALHPAATHTLVDALQEATQRTQILLTTHSADLLADRDLTPAQVLVVRNRNGRTHITPVDPGSLEIIRKELYSLADLQRMDQLDLDEADLQRQERMQAQTGEG